MKIAIKTFQVEMEIKNKGIELDVYSNDGKEHLGDLFISKAGIIWCKGRTTRARGVPWSWTDFIAYMEAP